MRFGWFWGRGVRASVCIGDTFDAVDSSTPCMRWVTTRVTVDSTEQHRPHRSVEGELQAELQVGHAAYGQSGHRSLTYPVTVTSAYDEVR